MQPFAKRHAPCAAVAHVIGMIDAAVQQLHLQHDPGVAGDRQDARQALGAMAQAVFVGHAPAVAAEADQVHMPRLRDQRDVTQITFGQFVVVGGVRPAILQADLGAVAHRTGQPVFGQHRPVVRTAQVDRAQAGLAGQLAQVGQRQVAKGPARHGMVDVALQPCRLRILGHQGHSPQPRSKRRKAAGAVKQSAPGHGRAVRQIGHGYPPFDAGPGHALGRNMKPFTFRGGTTPSSGVGMRRGSHPAPRRRQYGLSSK